MSSRSRLVLCFAVGLLLAGFAQAQPAPGIQAQGSGTPTAEVYNPPGTLWDNDVNNGTTSLASQDSTGAFLARTADDFTLDGANCASGIFDITRIRAQIVQNQGAPQAFGIELYDDNGSGTAPTPANAIVPIASFPESSQVLLGPFGVLQIFEASFNTPGFSLTAGTYWISAFGANGAANAGGFNNFFAASNGAPATLPNGVIIAPNAGVANWTPVEQVIGPPPLHFSFAIDGTCRVVVQEEIPTLDTLGLTLLVLLLAGGAFWFLRRRSAAGH